MGEPGSLVKVSDKKAERDTSCEERPSNAGEEEELACEDMASGIDGASPTAGDYDGPMVQVGVVLVVVDQAGYVILSTLVARRVSKEGGEGREWWVGVGSVTLADMSWSEGGACAHGRVCLCRGSSLTCVEAATAASWLLLPQIPLVPPISHTSALLLPPSSRRSHWSGRVYQSSLSMDAPFYGLTFLARTECPTVASRFPTQPYAGAFPGQPHARAKVS